jgi:DNA polymerase-3 subunit epsilon
LKELDILLGYKIAFHTTTGKIEHTERLGKRQRDQKGRSLFEMPFEYCTIDLETTGLMPSFDEIIEFAGVRIREGQVIDQFSTLIKPNNYIDDFISQLTGITNEMLEGQPTFNQVAPQIINFIVNQIIMGHNVHFDVNFLYDNLDDFVGQPLRNDFVDLMRLARRVLPDLPNHKLITLAKHFSIKPSGQHRALDDCFTTFNCFESLRLHIMQHNIDISKTTSGTKKILHKAKDITTCCTEFDESHPVYDKCFVFTGTLESMSRNEAMQKVVDLGGHCSDGVNKSANYLVLGTNDYIRTRNEKSTKHRKAEELLLKGQDIRIIPENIFYEMLENK